MRHAFHGLLVALVIVVACLVGACGSDGGGAAGTGGSAGSGGGPPAVGPRGGVVSSASGDGSASVPPGAVSNGTVAITVEELDRGDYPDPDSRWSKVFRFGPEGASFDIPVTIALVLDEDRRNSAATLWRLNEATDVWEEVELSYTSQGRVWGQTTGFSIFSAGPASAPNECTMQEVIALRTPGNVEVLVADLDSTTFIGVGTLFEQETGSVWITRNSSFTVQGLAGPPSGQGRWIDFASGPNFENGTFDVASDGSFSIQLEIPVLGFRYLGLTDACLGPFVSETNGWLYNLEVFCGEDCGQSVNAPPCQFPETVTMEAVGGSSAISASFGFLAGEECTLQEPVGLVRLLKFSRDAFGDRDVIVIAGLNRWTILTNSAGRELIAGGRWVDLPDATEITMTVQDADDINAPIYELRYRFDDDQLTVRSFIEL